MFRNYELVLVIDPEVGKEDLQKLTQTIEELLTKVGGKLVKATGWGSKELIYPIQKKATGQFLLWEISLEADKVIDLEKKLKLEKKLLRYLLIKQETPRQARGKGKNGPKKSK